MFTTERSLRKVKRIRRTFVTPISTETLPYAALLLEASIVEQQATETLSFTLSPDAWTVAFPKQATPHDLKDRVIQRVKEIEREMAMIRDRNNIILPSDLDVISQPIDIPYSPKKFGRRMWCICRDISLRIAFIQFIKDLRAKARKVRLQWLQGDRSPPFPTGLFPPSQPILSNILPAYFRHSIAVV
jgi:hypothetical protein